MDKNPQDERDTNLRNAIKDNDFNLVKKHIKGGANPSHTAPSWQGGDTPLQFAIIQDNPEIVQYLLQKGVDPNETLRKKAVYYLPPVLLCVHYTPPRLNALKALIADPRTKLNVNGVLVKGMSVSNYTSVGDLLFHLKHSKNLNIKNAIQQAIDLRKKNEKVTNPTPIKHRKFGP